MWSALAAPEEFAPLLPPPPPTAADVMVHAAWWTPLVHLARFGPGLPPPGAGLHALRGGVAETEWEEWARRLIALWWGTRSPDPSDRTAEQRDLLEPVFSVGEARHDQHRQDDGAGEAGRGGAHLQAVSTPVVPARAYRTMTVLLLLYAAVLYPSPGTYRR
jgi:hypothetical protein